MPEDWYPFVSPHLSGASLPALLHPPGSVKPTHIYTQKVALEGATRDESHNLVECLSLSLQQGRAEAFLPTQTTLHSRRGGS